MSSLSYSLLRSFRAFGPTLVTSTRKPGAKVFVVTVTETVTHRAKVEAVTEKEAWQKVILTQFVERFRQVSSEMSDISLSEEGAP